jgi:ABC-type branched-subunit amino acid transport system permease subunit
LAFSLAATNWWANRRSGRPLRAITDEETYARLMGFSPDAIQRQAERAGMPVGGQADTFRAAANPRVGKRL